MAAKSRIGTYSVSWLSTPNDHNSVIPADSPILERLPYDLPPETGEAWAESLALHDGIVLYRAVHALEPSPVGQLIPLLEVESTGEDASFNAQIWLSGLGCHDEYWNGRDGSPTRIVAGPGRDTFRHGRKWHAQVLVEGGIHSEMRSVVIPDALMQTLLGDSAAQDLLGRLGLSGQRPTIVHPMPQHISTPLREAMSAQLTGTVRKLYAQARILDYLAGLLTFVSEGKTVRREGTHRAKIRDLHHYLINVEGRVPTLTELADMFGISARRLNVEFINEFGQSIYGFLTEHRLAQAHAILLAEPVPMKILAARLGYSHVNHFSAAFKKKFGHPPGSLRKNRHAECHSTHRSSN